MTTLNSIPWTKEPGLRCDEQPSLTARALQGDEEAFAQLVRTYQPRVARLAQRLLGWDPDVDDIVQEVFTRAWERRKQLRDPEKVSAWLAAITVNATRQRLRRRKVLRVLLMNVRQSQRAASADEAGAGRQTERDEVGRRVRQAINALPVKDKQVLVLRYLEQMPIDEVAQVLGVRANTVEVRLHRARKRLAERLPEELRP